MGRVRRGLLLLVLALLAAPAGAQAGVRHLHFRYGPIPIAPGQNTIEFKANERQRPPGPGWITSFRPQLSYATPGGGIPRVDVVHLHHGVWAVDGYPTWAAGEEKTEVRLPRGYGYRFDPDRQAWLLNYMIHNLTPTPTTVYLEWDMDFIADGDPAAAGMTRVRTQWMDVEGIKAYPVFDVHRGSGRRKGEFTFPTDVRDAYRDDGFVRNRWTVDEDSTLVWTAGHLHPGGLHTDLSVTRDGVTKPLFRSDAHYFEPAGAVSWDVAMTNTPANWRVNVRRGDVLSVTGTYDSSRASWYESMAIMPVAIAPGTQNGVDPFTRRVALRGPVNHGHLPENDFHGGADVGLPDARDLIAGVTPAGARVDVAGFVFRRGDLSLTGRSGRPPTIRAGQSLTFRNVDAARTIPHTITACRAPCNRQTGIAYPLADGRTDFDSGELGYGPTYATATSNRDTWRTPKGLRRGTYTYFCRVHPFMRGAFRVR